MTTEALQAAIAKLTDIQRQAVEWDSGPLLVLAGPGSGKTQVLTCRIARLLDSSPEKSFRVLALTFTNKAADEMKGRVAAFVPGLEERATIGTFHSFCAQVLRQHGVHLGIKPDFAIYALDNDRKAVFQDALERAAGEGQQVSVQDVRLLPLIDRMKARLIEPNDAPRALARYPDAERIAAVFGLYEAELRRLNALDFNSLVLEAYKLATSFPAIAARYRRSYPYWMIDEFQDTNGAQYRLVKAFVGTDFKNVFAVADDDQIIYQWNGASFRNIQAFLAEFKADLIQLPTNYRCPPAIVNAANRLVAYNAQRTTDKKPLVAGKTELKLPEAQHMQLLEFDSEEAESEGIAERIAAQGQAQWGDTAVIARNRALLERMHATLRRNRVQSVIAQRRDDFLSPQFRWMVAVLTQAVRPLDQRNFAVLVDAFNRIAGIEISTDEVVAEAAASGRGYFASWLPIATEMFGDGPTKTALALAARLNPAADFKPIVASLIEEFKKMVADQESTVDLEEDMTAWRELTGDIARNVGRNIGLDQFLQELQLRSKEPSPKPQTVTLMTVHAAKGREFDYVYVIGLAEDVMPSYQARQKGDQSPEMEEERRNCFVAITRTKEALVLSRANTYRGWKKAPSRFLIEMGYGRQS